MKTLSIIGAGKVGKAAAKLFVEGKLCGVGQVVNRSMESGRAAVRFIGSGEAKQKLSDIQWEQTDILMIGTADDAIQACVDSIRRENAPMDKAIVFHLSGSIPSTILSPLKEQGATIAGVHPIKSFSDSETAAASFPGTFCGLEGDEAALAVLAQLFVGIGARVFNIQTEKKTLYHAASVVICNYLYALIDIGLNIYEAAGVERQIAMEAVEPILLETIQNAMRMGPEQALTGPIARGDANVIEKQMQALKNFKPEYADVYSTLGRATVQLARRKGAAPEANLREISKHLGNVE